MPIIFFTEIAILHCIGALMIFFAHVLQFFNISALSEILLAGVPLFLFVSGYLVGKSSTVNDLHWLGHKAKRIMLPYYIILTTIFVIFICVSNDTFLPIQWWPQFLNIQGLTNYLFLNDKLGYYAPSAGTGHFWFVTIIMVCYLLVIPISQCKMPSKAKSLFLLIFLSIIIQPLLLFYNFQINYILMFFWGWFFAKSNIQVNGKIFLISTLIMLAMVILRLVMRMLIDGSIFYNGYFAALAVNSIGVWIFILVYYLKTRFPKIIDNIGSLKAVILFESIIYEFYLIHHVLIKGSWSIYHLIENPVLATLSAFIICIVLSIICKEVGKKIYRIL